MSKYNPAFDPIPHEIAYFDGEKYQCYNSRCFVENSTVKECGQLPHFNGIYTPILRCEGCGALYFGIDTRETGQIHQEQQPIQPQEEPTRPKQQDFVTLPNLYTV